LTSAEFSVCAHFAERFDFVELVAKDYPFPRGLASPDIALNAGLNTDNVAVAELPTDAHENETACRILLHVT
jgi:hypothetical protein